MRRYQRRGISYILSVAVMTFVTVAMASVVLYWSIGQVSQSQNIFASAINARVNQAMERFTIEDVQFLAPGSGSCPGGGNGCVVVYVRDVGSTQVVIDSIYINNQQASPSTYNVGGVVPAKLSIGSAQVSSILAVAPFAISAGTTYSIMVASTRGNTVATSQTY